MSGATIETVCVKLDNVLEKLGDIKERNDEDHKAMREAQVATTQRLSAIDIQEAVTERDIKAGAKDLRHHTKRCEKRHAGLNKKLWAFIAAGLLGAGSIVSQFIIGGAP